MANDLGYAALANRAYKDPTTVGWAQQLQDNATAIVMLLSEYRKGCRLSYVDSNTIQVDTGSIMIAGKMRKNTTTATVNWASTGGNGIAETSATSYCLWAYASGPTSTFEVAINQTSASMTGCANARMIGKLYNGTGNAIEQVWDGEVGKVFGVWQTLSRSTVYQAETDGFVLAYALATGSDNFIFRCNSDNVNPPTIIRSRVYLVAGSIDDTDTYSIITPVKKFDYWEVTAAGHGTSTVFWVPIGGSLF